MGGQSAKGMRRGAAAPGWLPRSPSLESKLLIAGGCQRAPSADSSAEIACSAVSVADGERSGESRRRLRPGSDPLPWEASNPETVAPGADRPRCG